MNNSLKAIVDIRKTSGDSESQTERAFNLLEEMIATLELPPGASVSEATLSAKTGIGRTPIRMALQRLEHMGLVTSLARKGVFIRQMSVEDQLAILEVRRPLDQLLACKAARLATNTQREMLRVNADAMLHAAEAGDTHAFLRLDQICDQVIYQTSRNPYATDFVALLYSHSRRYWVARSQVSQWVRLAEFHKAMMHAIADGDESRAAATSNALIDYLEATCRSLIGMS